MNLRQLRYFAAIIETGNLTRAADRLHVAQTALGMQLRQLEEDIGITLVTRHSRGVEPTKAGRILYERALEILQMVERTRREVTDGFGNIQETIRFGCTPSLMLEIGTDLAVAAHDDLPNVGLQLMESMSHVLVEELDRGGVDYVICYDVPVRQSFESLALLREDLVLAVLPEAGQEETIPLIDALESTLTMPEIGDSVRNCVARLAHELGVEVKVAFEIRSVQAMKNLVIRGAAQAILPYLSIRDEIDRGLLRAQRIVMPPAQRTMFLAWSKSRPAFHNHAAIVRIVRAKAEALAKRLGPLAELLVAKLS